MPLIKDPRYNKFLQSGLIDILTKEEFTKILKVINHNYIKQARVLFILLYYSGRRPSEIVELKAGNFKKERSYLILSIPTKKKGVGSVLYFKMKDPHIQEVWDYVSIYPDEFYVFWKFKSRTKKKTGYPDVSTKVRYWVRKWSKEALGTEITPYFFRHNRLSELSMKGATPQQLKFWKGAKTLASVEPYLHLSQKSIKKMAKLL